MPRARRPLVAAIALFATILVGCYQPASSSQQPAEVTTAGDPASVPTATPVLVLPAPVILSVDTPTPSPARGAASTAPPTAPAPRATQAPAPPTPESTAAPTPVASPQATPTPGPTPGGTPPPEVAPGASTVDAFPFTDADLVAALVGRGLSYTPQATRVGCTGRAADVRHLDSPNGPPLTLWTYETPDDLKADWVLPSSGAPRPTIAACEVDGGWIYWYENLVIAFEPQDEWIPEGATRESIVAGFFSLSR